jgi:hypothetical protein
VKTETKKITVWRTRTNKDRRAAGKWLVAEYRERFGGNGLSVEEAVQDMMSDLMHYFFSKPVQKNLDPNTIPPIPDDEQWGILANHAYANFEAETTGGEP